MRTSKKGSLTIFFALLMLSFLTFCIVLIEGARMYFLKVKTEQAMELAEFSVLSEYQYELFRNYGLFFLDLDYKQGKEQAALLNKRTKDYLEQNAPEVETDRLKVTKMRRATDGCGQAFFDQAVEQMKAESGYLVFEELLDCLSEEVPDLEAAFGEKESKAEGILDEYVDEDGEQLFEISLPDLSFPSVSALTQAVFGSEESLSEKRIELRERISQRQMPQGVGKKEKKSLLDMQLFYEYLFEKYNFYGAKKAEVWKASLEYQLEYIIAGKESDRENLENIMWRIFLLRAGGNYLFYHQDTGKIKDAETQAYVLAGITGNPVLIELVREMILISQAIEDGISETKKVFLGEKVALYENGIFSGIEMGYQEYLYLFLNTTDETEKIYRSMDIAELEVREKSGYGQFRLDHCTDCFEAEWTYQFESLLEEIPLFGNGIYENTIIRKMSYEV